MDVQQSEPLKDLDWHGLANLSESRICAVLGVPATIVGVRVGLENSPYSHIDHAVQIFYRETMVPYWKRFAQWFTRNLLQLEGDDRYEIRYDFKEVRQLAEDAQEVSTRIIGEWNAGLITRNQALQTLGYQSIEGQLGDVIRVSVGAVELPIDSDVVGDMTTGIDTGHTDAEPEEAIQ
jgi:phage portal protein BeeE